MTEREPVEDFLEDVWKFKTKKGHEMVMRELTFRDYKEGKKLIQEIHGAEYPVPVHAWYRSHLFGDVEARAKAEVPSDLEGKEKEAAEKARAAALAEWNNVVESDMTATVVVMWLGCRHEGAGQGTTLEEFESMLMLEDVTENAVRVGKRFFRRVSIDLGLSSQKPAESSGPTKVA